MDIHQKTGCVREKYPIGGIFLMGVRAEGPTSAQK